MSRPYCPYHRCGLLLIISHVLYCLCVCVCVSCLCVGHTKPITMPCRPEDAYMRWGAHWRQLANTTERSVRGSDTALYPFTLATFYIFTDSFGVDIKDVWYNRASCRVTPKRSILGARAASAWKIERSSKRTKHTNFSHAKLTAEIKRRTTFSVLFLFWLYLHSMKNCRYRPTYPVICKKNALQRSIAYNVICSSVKQMGRLV